MVKDLLKQARIDKGLSQNDVAKKIMPGNQGKQYISNFERGISSLSPKVLKKYCALVGESYPAIAEELCQEITDKTFIKLTKKYGL